MYFFSKNTSEEVKVGVFEELDINASENPGKYLGMPMLWGRSRTGALNFMKDKMATKLQGWKHHLLTFASREILVKAVANAIPIFPMSCFSFPKKLCGELDGMVSKFWWGQKESEGRIHWKNWKSMSKAKGEGGMGFRDFECFSKALLAKTAWRLLQNPNEQWCRILKDLYFPNGDFLKARKGGKASWGWSSIPVGRAFLEKNLCWQINSGLKVHIFEDNWIPNAVGFRLSQRVLCEEWKKLKVSEIHVERQWNFDAVRGILSDEDTKIIRNVRILVLEGEDRCLWMGSKDRMYVVKGY